MWRWGYETGQDRVQAIDDSNQYNISPVAMKQTINGHCLSIKDTQSVAAIFKVQLLLNC